MEWKVEAKFIELHFLDSGFPIAFNIFAIAEFGKYSERDKGCYISVINSGPDGQIHVSESYDEIKAAIQEG